MLADLQLYGTARCYCVDSPYSDARRNDCPHCRNAFFTLKCIVCHSYPITHGRTKTCTLCQLPTLC